MTRDEEHKSIKSKAVKEEEVVRIPIAFAMVKLMQTLPPHIMEGNLPGYEGAKKTPKKDSENGILF